MTPSASTPATLSLGSRTTAPLLVRKPGSARFFAGNPGPADRELEYGSPADGGGKDEALRTELGVRGMSELVIGQSLRGRGNSQAIRKTPAPGCPVLILNMHIGALAKNGGAGA